MALQPLSGAKRLRQLFSDKNHIVTCPGVYDGLTARLALAAGFECLYMTGAGTSMSRLGWADLGMATLNDMVANASMIASLNPSVPLIADADTGYGGPVMVSRTVTQYARAGVAALHIEDQVQEKRCGHLLGKQIVDRETYYSRLRAAVTARDAIQSDMMIIARTDARQGQGFDEAVERLKEAIEIGVDIVFLEAIESKEEARKVCDIFRNVPVLLNMVPGGVTPSMTAQEAKDVGFRLVIFPAAGLEPVVMAVENEFAKLKRDGYLTNMETSQGVKKLFNIAGLQECIELDRKAGGKAYDTIGQ